MPEGDPFEQKKRNYAHCTVQSRKIIQRMRIVFCKPMHWHEFQVYFIFLFVITGSRLIHMFVYVCACALFVSRHRFVSTWARWCVQFSHLCQMDRFVFKMGQRTLPVWETLKSYCKPILVSCVYVDHNEAVTSGLHMIVTETVNCAAPKAYCRLPFTVH